jgi:hypothetical protein
MKSSADISLPVFEVPAVVAEPSGAGGVLFSEDVVLSFPQPLSRATINPASGRQKRNGRKVSCISKHLQNNIPVYSIDGQPADG